MSELSSKFTRQDLDTLIEAVGDWENLGMNEWHIAKAVKDAPMPPEEHEAFEYMKQIKEHFRSREQNIKDHKEARSESATFLKAKLLLVRKEMNLNSLFEMPVDATAVAAPKEDVPVNPEPAGEPLAALRDLTHFIGMVEFFIKDLGVWAHYAKFLSEHGLVPQQPIDRVKLPVSETK